MHWYLFSENAIVTIRNIAKFLTGSSKIPATRMSKNVIVKFKHGRFFSKSGNICKCLPTVSTFEIIVNIPVHITSEEDMMDTFKDALLCTIIITWSYLKVLDAQIIHTKIFFLLFSTLSAMCSRHYSIIFV